MFIFGGLKAAVTISGSVGVGLPQPTTEQTLVSVTGAFNDEATVYTVPAGKIFYCTGFQSHGSTSGNSNLKIDGTAVLYYQSIDQTVSLGNGILFSAAAGKSIVNNTPGASTTLNLQGYLVSV